MYFGLKSMQVTQNGTHLSNCFVLYNILKILGLGRLRDALSLERNVQPGRVLIHAAEALEHDLSLKRSVTQINQSSVQSEQGPASPTKSTTSFAPSTYSENIRIEVASPDRPSVNRNMLSGLEMLVGKTLAVESNQSPDPDH